MKHQVVRVALTGPECSGKTFLAEALAEHFNAPVAKEYARIYLLPERLPYGLDDLCAIAKGQMELENDAVKEAQRIAFFDTDMLVMKIWALYRFGRVPFLIEQAHIHRPYHLRLLCKPDLPWEPDPLRESPDQNERDLLFKHFERHLQAINAPYVVIEGLEDARTQQAIKAVEAMGILS